jgi:hypothetical protein
LLLVRAMCERREDSLLGTAVSALKELSRSDLKDAKRQCVAVWPDSANRDWLAARTARPEVTSHHPEGDEHLHDDTHQALAGDEARGDGTLTLVAGLAGLLAASTSATTAPRHIISEL